MSDKGFFDDDSMEWYWGFVWGIALWGALFLGKLMWEERKLNRALKSRGVSTNCFITKKWNEVKSVDGRVETHSYLAYDFVAVPGPEHGFQQVPYKVVQDKKEVSIVEHAEFEEGMVVEALYLRETPWKNATRRHVEIGTGICCTSIMFGFAASLLFCGIGLPLVLKGWTSAIVSIICGLVYFIVLDFLFAKMCGDEASLLADMIANWKPATDAEITELVSKFGPGNTLWKSDLQQFGVDVNKYQSGNGNATTGTDGTETV